MTAKKAPIFPVKKSPYLKKTPYKGNFIQNAVDAALAKKAATKVSPYTSQADAMANNRAIAQKAAEKGYADRANAYEAAVKNNANNQNNGSGNNSSGGGGSSGVGGVAAPAEAPVDPNALTPTQQSLADNIRNQIGGAQASNATAYEEAKAKIAAQYKSAANERQAVYAQDQAPIQENLKNLGMDFSSTDMAKDWNKDNRYLQEAADTSLATDQAWFDKMGTVNKDMYNSLLTELAQNELALGAQNAANAAAASGGGGGGGGGGGRRRGGGGGSSKGGVTQTDTNTLTDDELFYNPVLMQAIANEPDPYKRELLYSQIDLGGGQVNTALKNVANGLANANKPYVPMKTGFNVGNIVKNLAAATLHGKDSKGSKEDLGFVQQFLRQYSPNYGPISTKQESKTTSTQKGSTKNVPRTYNPPAPKPVPKAPAKKAPPKKAPPKKKK